MDDRRIAVRQARAPDAGLIADFQVRMAWETERLRLSKRVVRRGVRAVFADPRKGRYWLAEADGEVIACLLTIPEWSDWRNGTVLWIHSLYVRPEFRRQGVFRRLYRHLRHAVKTDGSLKGLRLYVARANLPAQRAYRALGMDAEHYRMYEWMKPQPARRPRSEEMPMRNAEVTRREFLHKALAGVGAGGAAAGILGAGGCRRQDLVAGKGDSMPTAAGRTDLSPHLSVFRGHVNVGIIRSGGLATGRDGERAVLIDCGDGRIAKALKEIGVTAVEQVLFTHHHRDQACGAYALAGRGAEPTKLIVPAAEKACFDNVEAYWLSPKSRWHLYDFHPHHLMLAESVAVNGTVADGQTIQWGPATIRILATPGHTDGSVSYLVEADGRRVIFCGDAIYDRGQVWDIHSLQKGVGTGDYHGFLGARKQLAASLAAIRDARADAIVPSHGAIIADPPGAIDLLLGRLEECYDAYVAISALRHYFPKLFAEYAGREGHMPIGPGKPVPGCLRHVGTSWILISQGKAALVMDCGGRNVIAAVQKMHAAGEISAVEGLWITHYHDDHVDAAAEFVETFRCPCIADEHVAAVIGEPLAWRLPCISPVKVKVDRPPRDGESWQWHEFRLSAYHLPGQTLYHGGLLAEAGGLRMLFAGDSFTMAGLDDYCAGNRNWLGQGMGFDRCVELVEKLRPTHIFNAHVDVAFEFTPEQCRQMRRNLARRLELYGRLVPWDHPNYGMDESWVRCHPYEQKVQPGQAGGLEAVITNHSAEPRAAFCRTVPPRAWAASPGPWVRATVPAKAEKGLALSVHVPAAARPGRHIIPVDVRYGRWDLPQFAEAIVVV